MVPRRIERDDRVVSDQGGAQTQVNRNLRVVEPDRPKPDVLSFFAASWEQNEEAYRYLGR